MKALPCRLRTLFLGASCMLTLFLTVSLVDLRAYEVDTDSESVIARMTTDLTYLSADEREGRGPGTDGIDQAANYIVEQFRSMGLITEVFDGSPYQDFTISGDPVPGAAEKNYLTFIGPPEEGSEEPQQVQFELGEQFTPLAVGGSGEFTGELVFCGYGITAEEADYDDFAELDVEGKVVIILRKEPRQDDPNCPLDGASDSEHAWFSNKLANAMRHGAAAVILINDNHDIRQQMQEAEAAWDLAVAELISQQEEFDARFNGDEATAEPTEREMTRHRRRILRHMRQAEAAQEVLAGGADELLAFGEAGDPPRGRKAPVYFASRAAIDPMVQAATGQSLADLEAAIDEDLTPHSQLITGWTATGEVEVVDGDIPVKNVLAVLEGEGPLANETVIIGAHYDHLGYGGNGSLSPWTHDIHNGADDNGSGTTALLEVARQLAAMPNPPARRIVFIAFTGEERGLLGSRHYCRSPRFALEDTVAMINLDMVGRLTDNNLTIYGTGTAESFDGLIESLNETYQFEIKKVPGGHGPSDHASFYAKDIPVLFFFTGLHNDYHRPSDDVEGINFEGMQQILSMVVEAATTIIAMEERPVYLQTRRPLISAVEDLEEEDSPRSPRPYFGCIPDYGSSADGLALTGVAPEGPAATAGLLAEDIIIQFGDDAISGIEDFDTALRKYEGGDEVTVVVLRNDERVTVTVTLGDPR